MSYQTIEKFDCFNCLYLDKNLILNIFGYLNIHENQETRQVSKNFNQINNVILKDYKSLFNNLNVCFKSLKLNKESSFWISNNVLLINIGNWKQKSIANDSRPWQVNMNVIKRNGGDSIPAPLITHFVVKFDHWRDPELMWDSRMIKYSQNLPKFLNRNFEIVFNKWISQFNQYITAY